MESRKKIANIEKILNFKAKVINPKWPIKKFPMSQ